MFESLFILQMLLKVPTPLLVTANRRLNLHQITKHVLVLLFDLFFLLLFLVTRIETSPLLVWLGLGDSKLLHEDARFIIVDVKKVEEHLLVLYLPASVLLMAGLVVVVD